MKIFICDSCGDQFNNPLDEEKLLDENGVPKTYDLCAPCRGKLKDQITQATNKFFNKIEGGK